MNIAHQGGIFFRRTIQWIGYYCLTLWCLLFSAPLLAAEIPWSNTPYSHFSNNEPLPSVLQSLMSSQNIPVHVSDQIEQTVSLRYTQVAAKEIFKDLVATHHLNWYFDGQMLYVYTANETHTATLQLKHLSVRDFAATAKRLGLVDPRFPWTTSSREQLIYFVGPQRYVDQIFELARAVDRPGKHPTAPVAYRWKDTKGQIHLSSFPPQETTVEFATIDLETFYTEK